jgi:asparagine synthetase B (glutamine-hydrolysing)
MNRELPPIDTEIPWLQSLDSVPESLSLAVKDLIFHLDRSVALRVSNIPSRSAESPSVDKACPASPVSARVAVLFSGGIDSTICAFLAAK